MQVDGPFYAGVVDAAKEVIRMRDMGYDGVYTMEGNSDPLFPLIIAAEHAPELHISTGIAVSFPRNPSHLAYQAWDLQKLSQGKFALGLGSQIKTHIEKRFGCEFSPAAERMKEQIEALKAFFNTFQHGERLNYQGKFYRHTLMTPMFDAGPNPFGIPPVWIGAVGPKMTHVAGTTADGLIAHPFHTLNFLRDTQLKGLHQGIDDAGREKSDVTVNVAGICITGENEQEFEAATQTIKGLLAFYGSTPAYLPPMKEMGIDGLHPRLNKLSKEGRWDKMAELVDDDFVNGFAVVGEPKDMGQKLWDKYGDMADRLSLYTPYNTDAWKTIIQDIKVLRGDK